MLELLGILGYSMIGFGLGGITIRKIKNKEINKNFKEFNKFQAEAENEIKQKDEAKETYIIKAQDTIKQNTELAKSNNRSLREIELLQTQLAMALQKIELLTSGGLKSFTDKNKNVKEKEEVKKKTKTTTKAAPKVKEKNNVTAMEELQTKIKAKSKLKSDVTK